MRHHLLILRSLKRYIFLQGQKAYSQNPQAAQPIAGLKKLVESGHIQHDESVVVYVTGNGLKAQDTLLKSLQRPPVIKPMISEFERLSAPKLEIHKQKAAPH